MGSRQYQNGVHLICQFLYKNKKKRCGRDNSVAEGTKHSRHTTEPQCMDTKRYVDDDITVPQGIQQYEKKKYQYIS